MKRHLTITLALLTVGLFLTRCASNDSKTSADKWFEDTKAEILKQSDLKPDSITLTFNEDSTFKKEHSFSAGREFLLKGYNKGILRLETHYSKDGNFELRREVCDNGNFGFEGIVYKSHFYGLSTWRHCNGQLDEQGVRHNDQKIGVWRKFDETGKQIEATDYKNIEKLDSMPILMK
jgi:antitoxin component YwqK of YwqJK toxin-antitoxin module